MSEHPDVTVRLAALEARYARLLYAWCALALAAATSIAWLAMRTPHSVSARRFVLRDASGAIRGEWGPSRVSAGEQDGQPVWASTTCLKMGATTGSFILQCAPWEGSESASIVLRHATGARATLSAGSFSGQLSLAADRPAGGAAKNAAAILATHAGSKAFLRHGDDMSQWTASGLVEQQAHTASKAP